MASFIHADSIQNILDPESHGGNFDNSLQILFHGTRPINVPFIMRDGMDPRKRKSRPPGEWSGETVCKCHYTLAPDGNMDQTFFVFLVVTVCGSIAMRWPGIVVHNQPPFQIPLCQAVI